MARPKVLNHKFQMMMSDAEVKQIDDWMFDQRLKSRADAIRRLVQLGIEATRIIPELSNVSIENRRNGPKIIRLMDKYVHDSEMSMPEFEFMDEFLRRLIEADVVSRELNQVYDLVISKADPVKLSSDLKDVHEIYRSLRVLARKSFDDYELGTKAVRILLEGYQAVGRTIEEEAEKAPGSSEG